MIDDSHGIGVLGDGGRGILAEAGVENLSGIYTASLGKALANAGGMIAGRKSLMDYLRYYCPHLVYSTALPPAVLGGLNKVLDIIEEEFPRLRGKMGRYKSLLSQGLIASGLKLADDNGEVKKQNKDRRKSPPISSIYTGSTEAALNLAKKFYQNKVLVTPFIPPSVPPNESRVRLIAGANLKEETIHQVLEIIARMGRES